MKRDMYPPEGAADLVAAAAGAVIAQTEGAALGGLALTHVFAGAAHLDGLKGAHAGAAGVVGAGVDGALDAGITGIAALHR